MQILPNDYFVLGAITLLFTSGCTTTYAPPIRMPQYGSPGRVDQGRMEVGGGVGGLSGPTVWGGPSIGYGVRDWLAIEAGGDFYSVGKPGGWAMGFGGMRLTYAPKRHRKIYSALDGEFGLGAGVGGMMCGGQGYVTDGEGEFEGQKVCREGPTPVNPAAFGAYTGIGYGLHLSFFSLFARSRVQTSIADRIPGTLWGNFNLGMQFRIAKHVDIYGGGGIVGLINRYSDGYGWTWDAGLVVHFEPGKNRKGVQRRGPGAARRGKLYVQR